MLELFDLMLRPITGKKMKLFIWENNQACITVCAKCYLPKLRHVQRTHKINLGSIKECIEHPEIQLACIVTDLQAADIFAKALVPSKWPNAIESLHFNVTPLPIPDGKFTHTGAERVPPPDEPVVSAPAVLSTKAVKAASAQVHSVAKGLPHGAAAIGCAASRAAGFAYSLPTVRKLKEDTAARIREAYNEQVCSRPCFKELPYWGTFWENVYVSRFQSWDRCRGI